MKKFSIDKHVQMASKVSSLMDEKFTIFGFHFGLDPILGLVPGLGDSVSLVLSLYILWIAHELQVPTKTLLKMIRNLGIDYVVGILPLVGDVADFFYKANMINLKLLKEHVPEKK